MFRAFQKCQLNLYRAIRGTSEIKILFLFCGDVHKRRFFRVERYLFRRLHKQEMNRK